MSEVWLKPNRRAIWFGCVPPLILGLLGAWMIFGTSGGMWFRWIGAAFMVVGLGMMALLLRQLRRPRIGYRSGQVLFYLQSGPPIAVPARIVEAFFLGQGPAHLPGRNQNDRRTMNLVARLSQREVEWARRDVKRALGQWCDGYVTIRGTWCEPLNTERIRRLNRRLHEVKSQADTPTP